MKINNRKELGDFLDFYERLGFNLIPVHKENKGVALKSWKEYQQRKTTPEQRKEWFIEGGYNVGIVCGAVSHNLLVVDIDEPNLLNVIFPNIEQLKKDTPVVKTPNGYHVYFRTKKAFRNKVFTRKGEQKPMVELKGSGSIITAPPSKREGKQYCFISSSNAIGEIPETQTDLEKRIENALIKAGIELKGSKLIDPDELWELKLREGEGRNSSLLKLATWCRLEKLSLEEAIEKLSNWNEKQVDPLEEREFLATVQSAYKPDKPYAFRFKRGKKIKEKKRRAFVIDDGKIYLEVITPEGYKFASLEGGKVELLDRVGDIYPQELPKKEGKVLNVVKLPTEEIINAKLLTPGDLFRKIEAHFKKYFDLTQINFKNAIYYTVFSWFYRKVNTLPYLRFLADTGKGKSRMLQVVGDLCFLPITLSGAGSFSGIMRTKERWDGTLIIDESDFAGDKESQVTKYLNLGFEKEKYYALSDKQNPKNQEWFDPFCPKAIAMRNPFNDNATEGRLISISPYETTRVDIPIILPTEYERETQELRNEIAQFVLEHWGELDGERMLSFRDLGIEPRLQQLAKPFSIIFQIWPDGEEDFREYLKERQKEIKRTRALSWEGQMFNFVISTANEEEDLGENFNWLYEEREKRENIQAITPSVVAKNFSTSAKTATQALVSIGFEVERRRIQYWVGEGDDKVLKNKQVRCYVISSEKIWREMVSRYYYSDDSDDSDDLEIPDILKGKKFFSVCEEASQVSQVSQKSKSVTDGTDGTVSNTRTKKILNKEEPIDKENVIESGDHYTWNPPAPDSSDEDLKHWIYGVQHVIANLSDDKVIEMGTQAGWRASKVRKLIEQTNNKVATIG